MIEMLFVLNIISMMILLTTTIHTPKINDQQVIQIISQKINNAKMNAITHKETTTITFSQDALSINSNSYKDEFVLPKGDTFDQYSFTYNQYGRIKTAKTVIFHGRKKDYLYKFQLGTGYFYVEQ